MLPALAVQCCSESRITSAQPISCLLPLRELGCEAHASHLSAPESDCHHDRVTNNMFPSPKSWISRSHAGAWNFHDGCQAAAAPPRVRAEREAGAQVLKSRQHSTCRPEHPRVNARLLQDLSNSWGNRESGTNGVSRGKRDKIPVVPSLCPGSPDTADPWRRRHSLQWQVLDSLRSRPCCGVAVWNLQFPLRFPLRCKGRHFGPRKGSRTEPSVSNAASKPVLIAHLPTYPPRLAT